MRKQAWGEAAIIAAAVCLTATTAGAQGREFYFGLGVSHAVISDNFGGFNTAGSFFNEDTVSSEALVGSLTFGARNAFQIFGKPVTAEVEYQYADPYNTVSDSFPGPPGPATFFYQSRIETQRLGFNLWASIDASPTWSLDGGLGIGAIRTDLVTTDFVVSSDTSDTAAYGMLGVRATRPIGQRGHFVLSARYFFAEATQHPLNGGAAGELTHRESGAQFGIGYQFTFGR